MHASLRDSKWAVIAMVAGLALVLLVFTIGSIEHRMSVSEGSPSSLAGGVAASHPGRTITTGEADQSIPSAAEDGEEIDPADSLEERIRKRFGMVKVAGVWLPATPVPRDGPSGALSGASAGESVARYPLPLSITTGKLPSGRAGGNYRARVEAVGGMPPYAWSIDRGAPASSVTLDRLSGELIGTPAESGTFTLRIRVTDSAGAADIAEYKMTISDGSNAESTPTAAKQAAAAPVGTATSLATDAQSSGLAPTSPDETAEGTAQTDESSAAPLTIVPALLAEARVGELYTAQFAAAGGTAPYVWSSLAPLPAGLTLAQTGILSGVPQEAGEFTLGIAVMDQSARSLSQTFLLKVTPAALSAVSGFTACISLRKVALSWSLPPDPSVAAVRILRNAANPPAHESDGQNVFEGQGSSAIDSMPVTGGSWYAAFTLSSDGQASEPVILAVMVDPAADPFADAVGSRSLLHSQAFNATLLPGIVLGSPHGGGIGSGSTDVVSLGAASAEEAGGAPYGGSLVISFDNNLAYDGPGPDFTIFENVFYIRGAAGYDPNSRMMEPAIVSVSQDGITWHTFPFDFSPRYDAKTGALNLRHPFVYNKGFAGVNPVIASGYNVDPTDPSVSGGDSFDLADLGVPGLEWIRYIRIQSTGDNWLTDSDGERVRHSNTTTFKEATRSSTTSGFDLDAVTAIWLDAVRQP